MELWTMNAEDRHTPNSGRSTEMHSGDFPLGACADVSDRNEGPRPGNTEATLWMWKW